MMVEKQLRNLTKEDLNKYKQQYLTIGKLRKFIEDNSDLSDDSLIMIERIEDVYYEKYNWGVYKKDSYYSNMIKQINENIDNGVYNNKKEYPIPPEKIKILPEELEEFKDEFHPAWGIARYFDESDLVFIKLHY
jgi:hypothetical protein